MSENATAAATGASATERFQAARSDAADTPPERLNTLIRQVLRGVHETIRGNDVTYPEYDALKEAYSARL
jgi:catechol 1,2-dioxygenase